jgi:glyoxylase I family protein
MSTATDVDAGQSKSFQMSKIRRLHHHAYPVADQEVNRHFMEDLIGIPLAATWNEGGEESGGMEFCHTFFELADGGAMAFFQMAAPFDKQFLIGSTNRLDHIALETDAATQNEIHERLLKEGIAHQITDHGYVTSLYVTSPDGLLVEICADPPDVDEIKAQRRADAHSELRRWLAGDHSNNNFVRGRSGPPVEYEGRSLYDAEHYGKA